MLEIAILGCGVVASGVVELLSSNRHNILKQTGEGISVKKVLARHPEKARALGLAEEQICTDFNEIESDPDISVVVELIGGTTDAYTYICRAMKAGKHVVTANKDLIALRFRELLALAEENRVTFSYEASVGGGIPLIGPLGRTLAAGQILSLRGILNGTTNYILTRMSRDGMSYREALALAQQKGYAEADPTSDVEGADAARKVAILSSLAFHTPVTYEDVFHEGISALTETDIAFAASSGYTVKLLGMASLIENGVQACVRPVLVPLSHPLATVSDAYNAVFLNGSAVGDVMLYGQGAGSLPTAGSVVGDIMEICRRGKNSPVQPVDSVLYEHLPLRDIGESENIYYVRLLVEDKPKVLSGIAGIFGDFGISVASLVQEQRGSGHAELMFFTHRAKDKDMRGALVTLRTLPYVTGGNAIVCME